MRFGAVGSGLIAAPLYAHWNCPGIPADDAESAMVLLIPATYFAKLAVTVQLPFPSGSRTTPIRGLHPLSLAVRLPMLSIPWFLSYRSPRFSVTLLFQRRLSLTNTECVRKFVPRLLWVIGSYSRRVRCAPVVKSTGYTTPLRIVEFVPRMR